MEHEFSVTIHRHDEAVRLIAHSEQDTEWGGLMAAAPSATVFQGAAYARAWWRTYGATHECAVARVRDGRGLRGQHVLVRPSSGGAWRTIGLEQNEYPAVLAAADDPAVVRAVLAALRRSLELPALQFLFLPPGSPVAAYEQAGLAAFTREHPRPVRRLADVRTPGKRTKGKLNQLRRRGVRAAIARDRAEIAALLDQFIPLHDGRQGAKGRPRPFAGDPNKRAYLLALAEEGLLHASALWEGDRLVASMLGVNNGAEVVLGLLAYAPELEALSPVACLLHELDHVAPPLGIAAIDLTPGGAYKQRFATTSDMTVAIDVAWAPAQALALLARREGGRLVRRLRGRASERPAA